MKQTDTSLHTRPASWHNSRIGDIVVILPQAATLFRSSGVDFCCGGHRTLGDALAAEGRETTELDSALDTLWQRVEAAAGQPQTFEDMPPADLTAHIESHHHSYLRQALPRLGELAQTVLAAHGANHPELFRVHALFGRLRTDLESHLIKEETALFPLLLAGDPARAGDVARLAGEIRNEHETAGGMLRELRSLTAGYTTPADGCPTYHRFMDELSALEADLFEHIHLENNILLREEVAA